MQQFNDPSTPLDQAVAAAHTLVEAGTTCEVWRKVTLDQRFTPDHRQLAAAMLLQCGLERGHALGEFGRLCLGCTWLRLEDFYRIDELGGEVPIDWPLEGCGFAISLGGFAGAGSRTVYVAFSHLVEAKLFYNILVGEDAVAPQCEVLDVVVFPRYW